ncbi:sensor histidine kinase [Microtetraspora malaysiensis]|uniref:sensor histidine kinase n=1 Tax=Microtetraspora malaysiensis TaxID=161358 RepID=UPI003D89D723
MRARLLSLLLRPTRPPILLGIFVSASIVAAETFLTYPLQWYAPGSSLSVVYLLGVLVVSYLWGLPLGMATAAASGFAFDYFHLSPPETVTLFTSWSWIPTVIFLVVALLVSSIAAMVRSLVQALEANRDELRWVAEEQAALRRVATLVARGVSPTEIFDAVACEMGLQLQADHAVIERYESDNTMVVVSWWSKDDSSTTPPVGTRWPVTEHSIAALVRRTMRPGRMTSYEAPTQELVGWAREQNIVSAVGSPIVVEGRLWGMMIALFRAPEPRAESDEERMLDFTELIATAISNAQARDELAASRARVVAASDETRHRIERDLHDGAQQRLISLGLELRTAEATVPPELAEVRERLSHAVEGLTLVVEDLRELSRGIHPAILSRGGLGPALRMLARRSPVPVELDVRADHRLPERVEVAVYYIVSEALTNVAKHAQASVAYVQVGVEDAGIRISVRDDGIGGADPHAGSGLIGLSDRVQALGGTMEVASPRGCGTTLAAVIPVETG